MYHLTNYIAGKRVDGTGEARTDIIDPSTATVCGDAPLSAAPDVDAAVAAATAAFPAWSRLTPRLRAEALTAAADALGARIAELTRMECKETGKPFGIALSGEMASAIDHLRFMAGAARATHAPSAGEYASPRHTSWVRREPVGVVAAIVPWNYPFMMAMWKIAPALAAGCTVVLKPAEQTPSSVLAAARVMAHHLPVGALNVVCGNRHTGQLLVDHPGVAMVSFTGSVRAGREVATDAADGVKRVHLELGGNAPVIVFDDCPHLDLVAEAIAIEAFTNAGQSCTAASRVLAGARVYDELILRLAAEAERTKVGPCPEAVNYGPLNNAAQLERVEGLVGEAGRTAKIVRGGAATGQGYCFAPTVIAGPDQDSRIVQEEIFGPVITVQRFRSFDDALAMANDVPYGLAASVWTPDHARALRFARDLNFGVVWINDHQGPVAEMPHGGFGQSGYGKDLSTYGLDEFVRVKHVMSRF